MIWTTVNGHDRIIGDYTYRVRRYGNDQGLWTFRKNLLSRYYIDSYEIGPDYVGKPLIYSPIRDTDDVVGVTITIPGARCLLSVLGQRPSSDADDLTFAEAAPPGVTRRLSRKARHKFNMATIPFIEHDCWRSDNIMLHDIAGVWSIYERPIAGGERKSFRAIYEQMKVLV